MNNPPRTIRRDTRFFISAVTRELGTVRKLVKKALEDNDYHAVEQDNFPPDYRDLIDKLRERINSCDAVIHIAGHAYGAEPPQKPDDAPRRSYTQLEHDIARELKKPVYVFLTGDNFPADPHEPEPPELLALQAAHRDALTATGRDYNPTTTPEELDRKVRSLKLKVEILEDELHQVDHKVALTGRRLRRWLVVSVAVGLLVLGSVGYLAWWQRDENKKQEQERMAAEAERKQSQTIKEIQKEIAEGLLQELLADKTITADEARERALKRLATVKLPLAEIKALIDAKIPTATEATLTPLDKARAALAKGDYDAVFPLAAKQKQQGREMAMLEGTAALARFRMTPQPKWRERALAAFRRAMALADPNSESEWEAWTDAADSTASVFRDLARYAESEPILRECWRIRESRNGPNSPKLSLVLNNLAILLHTTNRLVEAETLYRRSLAIDETALGSGHPGVAIHLNNLAGLLSATNRAREAEPLYRRSLAIDEASLGPGHPSVARDLNNLAVLLMDMNRAVEAEPLYRRSLVIVEALLGPDNPEIATRLNNLALLLKATNRPGEAEPLYRRSLAIDEAALGPYHPGVARNLNNLAMLLEDTNRPGEAEPLYRRSLAIDETALGSGHPGVAIHLNNLAGLLSATNRAREAEPLYRRSLAIFVKSLGQDHQNSRVGANNYRLLLKDLKFNESEIAARIKAVCESTEKLTPIVPEVERLLGQAKPTKEIFEALDKQYRQQGRPPVWFLPLKEPIAPHLDELLGKVPK